MLYNILAYPPWGDNVFGMKNHVHETHSGIVKRLKRAEGHLHKVIEMFADGRPCLDLGRMTSHQRSGPTLRWRGQ